MLKYFNSQAWGRGLSRDFIKKQTVTGFFHSIFAPRRQILDEVNNGKPATQMGLVKLAGDDGVLNQKLEWHDLEGVFVGGFEDDRAGGPGLLDLQPAGSTDAPAVAGFEASETELRHGGTEVVAQGLGGFKEW